MLSNNFWSIFSYIKGLKFEDIEANAIRMKKQKSTIGKWTMKTKSGKWFTQVRLKNQGLKASKEQNLSPIIGFSRWEGSMEPFQKIHQIL